MQKDWLLAAIRSVASRRAPNETQTSFNFSLHQKRAIWRRMLAYGVRVVLWHFLTTECVFRTGLPSSTTLYDGIDRPVVLTSLASYQRKWKMDFEEKRYCTRRSEEDSGLFNLSVTDFRERHQEKKN